MNTQRLIYVYEGWEGYNRSLVSAVAPLTEEQLAFRAHPEMPSAGEVAWHIADGRVDWFKRIDPRFSPLEKEVEARNGKPNDAEAICRWLNRTWEVSAAMLEQWTVEDLPSTYRQPYQGKVYAVSRQWVIWRIMCHDIHHGGQLSELLAMQSVFPLELTLLGGHLTDPPEAPLDH
ncbi:MAG TPA: DinB family protein [Fimbriimonadaceae bacterium]|nr:DinB family protein [Fimbriimonadaceae bacterium]